MTKYDDEKHTHPAFGNIQINRVQGHASLYDSPLHHGHFIALTISTASYRRDLYRRWHMPDEMVCEVYLSASQFAEAITNMNTIGIPCTLRHYRDNEGKFLSVQLDAPDHDKQTHEQDVKDKVAGLVVKARAAKDQLEAALDGKTVKKGDLKELQETLYKLHQDLESNLPFVQRTFYEAMEKVEQQAKTEIVALADHVVYSRGLQSLGIKDGAALLGAQPKGLLEGQVDELTDADLEAIAEEVEDRVAADLAEAGEDAHSDSDRAMYLRQDYRVQVTQEFREKKRGGGDG